MLGQPAQFVLASIAGIWLGSVLHAAERHVPSEYPTIQAAVDACVDGDVVTLADGTYVGIGNRDIDVSGKQIAIRSVSTPEQCVIDCEGAGRGFLFETGETRETVLQGITIQNGHAIYGGGIYVDNDSAPTIDGCVIRDCFAYDGGGIFIGRFGSAWAAPRIVNSTITNNEALWYGGGVCANSQGYAEIHHSSIQGNSARWGGGGICINISLGVRFCDIADNVCEGAGSSSHGGGIFVQDVPSSTLTHCTLRNNRADARGGGVYSRGNIWVSHCVVAGNLAGYGGGLAVASFDVAKVSNCLVVSNTAREHGGAFAIYDGDAGDAELTVVGCTIASNRAVWDQDLLYREGFAGDDPRPEVMSCIFWDYSQSDVQMILNYCLCDVGCDFGTNMEGDALFLDPNGPDGDATTWDDNDYHLQAGSPAIDHGQPALDCSGWWWDRCVDLDGLYREWDGDGDGGHRMDIGAYEHLSHEFGDLNCDEVVNNGDIDPFVLALTDLPAYEASTRTAGISLVMSITTTR